MGGYPYFREWSRQHQSGLYSGSFLNYLAEQYEVYLSKVRRLGLVTMTKADWVTRQIYIETLNPDCTPEFINDYKELLQDDTNNNTTNN